MGVMPLLDRKSTRLNSSHGYISYAVFCLKKKETRRDSAQASVRHPDTHPITTGIYDRNAARNVVTRRAGMLGDAGWRSLIRYFFFLFRGTRGDQHFSPPPPPSY